MKYWLVKSEPETWSWNDHVKKGIEPWNGVRNYQATSHLRSMKIGDQAFFYHSVKEKSIVGIVEVVKEHYPDHTDKTGKFVMVDFKALRPLPRPVTLAEIKAHPDLQSLPLIRQSRLSVLPVGAKEWKIILGMSNSLAK